jgi:N-acetylneuraminic acid mutarotase
MCIDVDQGLIYLFGGWDGQKDLSDFWVYSIQQDQWTCLSSDTRRQGGPGPRSCHKICLDPKYKHIYVLGRYIDPQSRPGASCDSDFFRFDTAAQKWVRLSDHTATQGGPELIYDHQMALDADAQVLYIFGGRIINGNNAASPENTYSGLFAYYIAQNSWKLLRSDLAQPDGSAALRSRIGHSMLLHSSRRQLYIFAGQRHKDYLSDFYVYDIDADRVTEMNRDYSKNGGPEAGFTQRATIDVDLNEFYVFSGLMREKNSASESVNNSFWSYNITQDRWCRVYHNENVGEAYWSEMANVEPCPRFAHQLVYDHVNKVQYLFGGNPGETQNTALRLDDFWSLRLEKPDTQTLLRRSRFLLRQQQFKEMCAEGKSMQALKFMQTVLSGCVDSSNAEEDQAFRSLTTLLFDARWMSQCEGGVYGMRTGVYEQVLKYFPDSMKQPHGNLLDHV